MDIEDNPVYNSQLVRSWNILENKLTLIYDEHPSVNLLFLSECYNEVFNYLMHVNKEHIEKRNAGTQELHPGRTQEISRDLYLILIGFMYNKTDEFAEKFQNVPIERIFSLYATEWRRYKMIHKKLHFIFRYLDRFYVPNERNDENFDDICEVYMFALKQWLEKVFLQCQTEIINEIVKFLKQERDGREIDKEMVSCASKSFIELSTVPDDEPLMVYRPLEKEFLRTTREYYREKGRKLMFELNVVKSITFEGYMLAIHEAIAQETERVKTYLDESSIDAVVRICEECLILEHKERFGQAFGDYLTNDQRENLAELYKLISKFPEAIDDFHSTFKSHIEREGDEAIGKLDNVVEVTPKVYVEAILTVYKKFESIVENELKGNSALKQTLEDAAKMFINNNAVTQASAYKDRNAELLAKYCDVLLSKDSGVVQPEEELEKALGYVLLIALKMLTNKDGFQKFYENITARRMIFFSSVSNDMEDFMILKLKEYFGEQDSHNLKKISENIKASDTINNEFKAVVNKEKDSKVLRNFSVVILSDKHWPYKSSSPYASSKQYLDTLPVALEPTIDRFTKFYKEKFTGERQPRHRKIENLGRRLQWLHNLGKGELEAFFMGKKYIFMVGAFQMAVLMQFNENDSYTFEELKKNTGIMTAPAEFLQQTLAKLFESKILLSSDSENIQSTTRISINVEFQSKRVRLNLDRPIDAEEEINRKEIKEHIGTDRELLTQCAIVRVMKRERRIHRTTLIGMLLEELRKRFDPEVEMVKRALSVAITKDFVAKDPKDDDYYLYVE